MKDVQQQLHEEKERQERMKLQVCRMYGYALILFISCYITFLTIIDYDDE
jgi:hypothetical protein